MQNCFQFKTQNVLQHGESVLRHYRTITIALDYPNQTLYKVPQKFSDNWDSIRDEYLYDYSIMEIYQKFHDCGKPFCKVIDQDGKQHFPNHANISKQIFDKVFSNESNKEIICKLIENDMMFHSGKSDEINKFIEQNDLKFLFSLWLTSLSELYANKEMFDVDNQLSFKIKYKKLESVLNKIMRKFENDTSTGS